MFEFKVKYVEEGKDYTSRGLVAGCNSYAEAMAKVCDYFGDNKIEHISLSGVTTDPCVVIYKEGVKSIADQFDEFQ